MITWLARLRRIAVTSPSPAEPRQLSGRGPSTRIIDRHVGHHRRQSRALFTFLGVAAIALFLGACSAALPGWTYDPQVGQPTGALAAAASGTPSEAESEGPAPAASGTLGGSPAPAGSGGPVIDLAAKGIAFDQTNLTVPAGAPFQIQFDNQDSGIPHNVAIYGGSSPTNVLFRGTIVNGPGEITYDVPALPPGTYEFRCDVHPTVMKGTIVVH
jgi:plastocyanin